MEAHSNRKEADSHVLTTGHQFDLPVDGGHAISGQAAHRQRVFQVTEDDLALKVSVFVKVGVHRDLGGVGWQGRPGGSVVGAASW